MKKISAGLAVLFCAALLCGLFLFTGCAQKNAKNDGSVKLRFMWWGGDARHEATLKVIEQFTAKNPNVKIDAEYGGMDGYYQKLTTQISSGTEADIIQIVPEWFKPLGKSGKAFYSLETDGIIDISGFNQDFLQANCVINGQVQGLPTGNNGSCFAVNLNFLAKYGIPADTKWNWDNLKTIGMDVHAKNPSAYLVGGYATHISALSHLAKYYLLQLPGVNGYVNQDYTLGFTADHLVQTFEYFLNLQKNGVLQPLKETSIYKSALENPSWVSGNIGLMDAMPSTLNTFITPQVSLDAVPVPIRQGAEDTGSLVGPPQFLVISAKSRNPAVALQFLQDFFNDSEALTTLNTVRGMPPTTGATDLLAEKGLIGALDAKSMNIAQENASKSFNLLWLLSEFETPYSDACNAVMLGTLTPKQAADKMIKDFNEACTRLKSEAER